MDVRVGLVGCGRWGRNLARVLAQQGALAAIAVRHPEPVRELAASLGAELVIPDALLARADIQAVAIATPAATHAELTRAALRAGKHVFVEKPMALTMADARACAEEARLAGRVLVTGHILRHHPAFVRLAELVRGGAVGRLTHVSSRRFSPAPAGQDEGPLWILAPHDASMVLALCGPATAVEAAREGERYVCATRHEGSVTARIEVARGWTAKEQTLIAYGEAGALVFDDSAADPARRLVFYGQPPAWDAAGPRLPFIPGRAVHVEPGEPLALQMAAFLEAVRRGRADIGGPGEAVAVIELLARAQAALAG